jgi:hypothetical protein
MRRPATLCFLIATLAGPAAAVELGGLLPGNPVTDTLIPAARGTLDAARDRTRLVREALSGTRDIVGRPLLGERERAGRIDLFPDGSRAVSGQILASAPSPAAEAIWKSEGFEIVRRDRLDPLGLEVVVLEAPGGLSGPAALTRLRTADPAGSYDLNHLYDPSSSAVVTGAALVPAASDCDDCRIGVVDSGADLEHRDLRRADIETRSFTGSAPLPSIHGTAIASLLVGRNGAARGAELYLADIYGGKAEGGSAEAIARALAWLATEETPVVTLSLAGPPNAVLQAAVAAMIARGHIVIAAVGNGGPAAPAAYPAAYPGVIGATAIDAAGKPAIDAQRGPQVSFAAYGVDLDVAAIGGGETTMSGTSLAAPRIAARAAALGTKIDPAESQAALKSLQTAAVDLGTPGRDDVFGYGALEPLTLTAASSP